MREDDWTPRQRVSAAEIEAAKSPKGGWTYAQLNAWGVPTPPPRGWKDRLIAFDGIAATDSASARSVSDLLDNPGQRLISGEPFGVEGHLDIDPVKLLRKVVMAVINAGHASCLNEFPDVLAYFKARMPSPAGGVSTECRD